ncbi:MATE family efflux transporter [Pelosinus fermentans]|uniref:Multidrug export protein MepA n=1 Tax=Pelosinus fermentans JBW45 TaxID=1192197 RepID=I8U0R3_9FIRM|nr:MATE family efflux transporter [Pelosinus fermentans]AJQ26435.1 MATE efflux family protein [Pelosinus fermentans JBW45]
MKNDIFENQSIPKAVGSLALPTIMGMLVMIVYNLAGTFFVGQLHDANQVAAITITMPVFLLLMAFGSLFGVGGGSYISILLGKKEGEEAKQAASVAFYGSLAIGVICMLAGLLFMPQILHLSGASDNTYEYAKGYLMIIAVGSPAIVASFALGQIIRAEGAAKQAMAGMMIGTVINIALDPIFILWLGMGVTGAAIATVIANIISVSYYIYYFVKNDSQLSISFKKFVLNKAILKAIFSIGTPASINSLLMSTSNIILNNFAVHYGDNVVAALGVVSRVVLIPIMLLFGLCQGVQPLIGYNYAANNRKRMISIINFTALWGTAIGTIFALLFYWMGKRTIEVFINDPVVVDLGENFLQVILLSIPFLGIQFLLTTSFQAMGEGIPSLWLSISRQGILFIPILIIANAWGGLKGVIYAQPMADIMTTVLAVVLFYREVRKEQVLLGKKQ